LQSVTRQDWPNLEILVVDDCSTDGSFELLQTLRGQDKRIQIFRHSENAGVGAARNTLVQKAAGDFVAFFDDDDESVAWRLRQQYDRIVAYEQTVGVDMLACYSARQQLWPHGKIRYEPTLGMEQTPAPAGGAVVELILLGKPLRSSGGTAASCSLMARRSVFERAGNFNAELRREEDTDFNLRLALMGGHFPGIAEPLVTQSITPTADKSTTEERKNAMKRIQLAEPYLRQRGWFVFVQSATKLKFDWRDKRMASVVKGALNLLVRQPVRSVQRLYWLLLRLLRARRQSMGSSYRG
jgi:hypothetical protein